MNGRWVYYGTNCSRVGSSRESWRVTAALLLMAFSLALTGCHEEILHDLSEREANKVVSHLSVAKLDAKKVLQADGRWAISVAREEMVPALTVLDTQRVLVSRAAAAPSGKGSIIPSREEQWFRYERSLASSIEESLSAIPGVLEGRVHINLPDEDPLFPSANRAVGSGSVLLVVDELFAASDEDISSLVAGAAGIPREGVRILKSYAPRLQAVEPPVMPVRDQPPSVSKANVRIPWLEAVSVCSIVAALIGLRRVRARIKKKKPFSLPKELDFEG